MKRVELRRESVEDFEQFPFCLPAIRELDSLDFDPAVTFLVGENGTGKSTIIEAIALALGFGPEGGTKNVRISSANDTSPLYRSLKLTKSFAKPKDHYFLRAESFYNVATYMDEVGLLEGYGGKSLHQRSHGEAFLATLQVKLKGAGLYLFDEPEAALSPQRQLAALCLIHQLVQDESQFIIATHSPILMAYPGAKIFLLDDTGLSLVKYEDTEHFAVMRNFLNNYEGMLHKLLADDT